MVSVQLMAVVEVGQYVNIWKILPVAVVLLIWGRLLAWADKDAIDAHLPRLPLNAIMLAVLLVGLLVFPLLPSFVVAFPAFFTAFLIDIAIYLVLRNQKVGLTDLKKEFKHWISTVGRGKEKEVKVAAGSVGLINKAGKTMEPPDSESPDAIGYQAVQKLLSDPLRRHAEQIDMIPQEGSAGVRFQADGVTFPGTSLARDEAAAAVTYIKRLAGLDLIELRKPQSGSMKLSFGGKRLDAQVNTAGSTAGESVSFGIEVKKRHDLKIEELGLTDSQLKAIDELVAGGGGIVLVSAPKAQGLTSQMYAILRKHDAFVEHIQTIERNPPIELEGIKQNTLPSAATSEEETKLAEWVCSQEPDIVAITQMPSPRTAATLVRFAAQGHRVYVGSRAGTTFDALAEWRKVVGDDAAAMKDLRFVINGRVIRKLCMACKVGYTADPETLRRWNMSPDKVGKLFQARTQSLRDQKGNPLVCEFCQDMRFVGRVGVYETFAIDDEVRNAVVSGGTVNQLKAMFRKQRQKYLTEVALARVEVGDTSVQEVQRVLSSKPGSGGQSGQAKTGKPKPPGSPSGQKPPTN